MTYETIRTLSGLTGLILFGTLFVGIVFWTFRPGAKKQYDTDAHIPLREED
ncbi:MAG: CcoQ/FixQ family Cbb3-type cytochrome c oxidase assembly chaperone [Proteobacteria bacterium]|nr:CcoQ/FixQ family Cbb3-type cytochrome c oxidase assembly chaperone [Pseudomonadota bacterium]